MPGRLPPKTTWSRVWPQWLGKNDFFSSLSFLQAFLGPWAEHCEPWWDKQKSCVFINHKGTAHTGVHGKDTVVRASGGEILKEPSSKVKSRVKTASRDKGGYLVDERLILMVGTSNNSLLQVTVLQVHYKSINSLMHLWIKVGSELSLSES